jgi:trigger factor
VKVSVEKLPTSEAVLEVDVTWDELEKASQKAYRRLVQKVDIQGFRRGKAPRSLLERRLGKEYIYQEGLDDLISETYSTTLKEHNLIPISQPKLDAPTFELGQPYHFSLTVPIITPVELGDYHDLHFEREEASVTSEEVDKELEALRNRMAAWKIVERPATYNDRVTVDLKLTSGEQQISDLKDNPFELTEERNGLFTGMDEQVVGMQAGESKTFSTTIPADYSNEKLAGQQADYEVVLHKVEEKELPELNDGFADSASNGQYQTLEDLSKFLSDNILETKKRQIRDELRNQVTDALIERSKFTIHPLLIEQQAEDMLHQFEHMLEEQRISLDQYLMMMRKSREAYLQEIQPEAEKSVKRQLVLDEVARREGIQVVPDELEGLFALYAQSGQALPRTEEQARALASSYRREKTLNRLVEITAGPDPDSETGEAANSEQAEERSAEEYAKAAALEGESLSAEAHTDNEASAKATPLPGEPDAKTVE